MSKKYLKSFSKLDKTFQNLHLLNLKKKMSKIKIKLKNTKIFNVVIIIKYLFYFKSIKKMNRQNKMIIFPRMMKKNSKIC